MQLNDEQNGPEYRRQILPDTADGTAWIRDLLAAVEVVAANHEISAHASARIVEIVEAWLADIRKLTPLIVDGQIALF